ncbi:MAG: PEP-CTERM sorting domain-containing protein [Phycisphaerales bacterium]
MSVNAAQIINFDPDGVAALSAVQVGSFDFLPGNSLWVDHPTIEDQGTMYVQTRLGSLLDANGMVINVPGLNSTGPGGFEITIVAELPASATTTTINTFTDTTLIQLISGTSGVRMFYDATPNANDLAGTGFFDGVLIFDASVKNFDASAVSFLFLQNFDQFGANNYSPILSPILAGGGLLITDVPVVDPSFFLNDIQELLINSNLATSFTQANPSAVFDDGAITPSFLGNVNGGGDYYQIQNDSTGSFTIPEPTTIALLGFAGLALIARRRNV